MNSEDTLKVFARPLDMFMSKVPKEKYPDIQQEYRFELLPEKQRYISFPACTNPLCYCQKEKWNPILSQTKTEFFESKHLTLISAA